MSTSWKLWLLNIFDHRKVWHPENFDTLKIWYEKFEPLKNFNARKTPENVAPIKFLTPLDILNAWQFWYHKNFNLQKCLHKKKVNFSNFWPLKLWISLKMLVPLIFLTNFFYPLKFLNNDQFPGPIIITRLFCMQCCWQWHTAVAYLVHFYLPTHKQ